MSDTRSGGVIPPKQPRAQETLDRILDACERLLQERRFDEISTTDLCNESGVSVSSLYARFASKDDVLLALIDRHAARLQGSFEFVAEQLAEDPTVDLAVLTRVLVSELVYFTHSHDYLETTVRAYPTAGEKLREVNEQATLWVLERTAGIVPEASDALARRIEFAIRSAASVAHRAIGGNVRFAERMGMEDAELVEELTRMTLAYVEVALAAEILEDAGSPPAVQTEHQTD